MQSGLRYLSLGTYAELRTGDPELEGTAVWAQVPRLSWEREIMKSMVMQCGLRYLGLGTLAELSTGNPNLQGNAM